MEIIKNKSEVGYIISFKEDNQIFTILFAGNLDLYWLYDNLDKDCYVKKGTFTITKENYFIYSLFEKLYNDVINCNIFKVDSLSLLGAETLYDLRNIYRKKEEYNSKLKQTSKYNKLYSDGVITWISDDRDYNMEDKVVIKKEKDQFLLTFTREKKNTDLSYLNSNNDCIIIRFRNSGSSYYPFNCLFMDMYNRLQEHDFNDKQMHIEEYLYRHKQNKKQ